MKNAEEEKKVEDLMEMQGNDEVPAVAQNHIESSKALLNQAFNFYSFNVELNQENKMTVMNKIYNKLLEKKVIEEY